MEVTFPIYKKEDKDHDYHTIDGLSFLTEDIVGKWGSSSIPQLFYLQYPLFTVICPIIVFSHAYNMALGMARLLSLSTTLVVIYTEIISKDWGCDDALSSWDESFQEIFNGNQYDWKNSLILIVKMQNSVPINHLEMIVIVLLSEYELSYWVKDNYMHAL